MFAFRGLLFAVARLLRNLFRLFGRKPWTTARSNSVHVAGSLAASAFIAVTQFLTGVKLDLPLYVALVAFALSWIFEC